MDHLPLRQSKDPLVIHVGKMVLPIDQSRYDKLAAAVKNIDICRLEICTSISADAPAVAMVVPATSTAPA
jgi:hypothetical protein